MLSAAWGGCGCYARKGRASHSCEGAEQGHRADATASWCHTEATVGAARLGAKAASPARSEAKAATTWKTVGLSNHKTSFSPSPPVTFSSQRSASFSRRPMGGKDPRAAETWRRSWWWRRRRCSERRVDEVRRQLSQCRHPGHDGRWRRTARR